VSTRYNNYLECKPSGLPWIGSTPKHWKIKPTLAVADEKKNKNDNGQEDNVLSLSYGKIIQRDVETNFGLLPESFNTYQIVDQGDMILRLTDLQNDKRSLRVGHVQERGIITSAYLCLRPKPGLTSDYMYRLLHSYDTSKVFYGMGGGLRQSMKFDDFRRLPLLVPPLPEQRTIAAFLDRETGMIDRMIGKQGRMIELLKEKRQAVISHAVTKGLDPDVPMKDSGVEWLGEIPENWGVSALGYYAKLNTGATPDRSKPEYWNGDIPWIKTGEVRYDTIHETEECITEDGFSRSAVQLSPPGTLLMAMYGQGVTRGRVAILGVEATYNQACAAITPNRFILNTFLRFYFMAAYHALRDGGNLTSQMNLNADIVSKFKITVPPSLDEQKRIVSYLKGEMNQYDHMITKAEQAIELMKERRTALISAAVAGKIDVREAV